MIDGHGIHHQPEEQQLAGIEAFGLGAVEPAEQRRDLGFVLLLQGFDGVGGFLLDLFDRRVLLCDLLIACGNSPRSADVPATSCLRRAGSSESV